MLLTQREKNRLREHAAPGHRLRAGAQPNKEHVCGTHYAPGQARLYRCTCGWFGWMQPGLGT